MDEGSPEEGLAGTSGQQEDENRIQDAIHAHWAKEGRARQKLAEEQARIFQPLLQHQMRIMEPLLQEQARVLQPLLDAYAQWSQRALQPLLDAQERVARIASDALQHASDAFEWQRQAAIRAAFEAYGLMPNSAMPPSLIHAVIAAHAQNTAAEEVYEQIIAFYNENDCAAVERMITDLCASAEFSGREGVLRDVLAAHRGRLDSITTQALVPIIEGITVPALQGYVTGTLKHNRISSALSELVRELPAGWVRRGGGAQIESAISYIGSYVFQSFNPHDPSDLNTYTDHVQRHALMHGKAKSGTRLNTIRCLLILDALRVVLPMLRAAYDPEGDADSGGAFA